MKRKLSGILAMFFLFGICLAASDSLADNIKTRMMKRLPVIKSLKARGIVGENNMGYLQFMGPSRENQNTVNAENSDRRQVYTAIARQQRVALGVVEKRRAAIIYGNAQRGEWVQAPNGRWHRK